MRSFKKMLAAVSAVTIAFGAMALQVGAFSSTTIATNGTTESDIEGLDGTAIVEGSKIRVTYTSEEGDLADALKLILRDSSWNNWTEYATESGHGTVDGSYYADYSYETISAFPGGFAGTVNAHVKISTTWGWDEGTQKSIEEQHSATVLSIAVIVPTTPEEPEGEKLAQWENTEESVWAKDDLAKASGKYVATYTSESNDTNVCLTFVGENIWDNVEATSKTTVDGVTTVEYSYADIAAAVAKKGFDIANITHVRLTNAGENIVYVTSGPTYVAPAAETITATKVGSRVDEGDGYVADTYTFDVAADTSVVVVVTLPNVPGKSLRSGTLQGEATFGLIVATDSADKLDAAGAPVITIQ